MHVLAFLQYLLLYAAPLTDRPAVSLPGSFAGPVAIRAGIALMSCLVGIIVALVAGILVKRSQRLSMAILAGGGAFVATTTLCLLISTFVLSR
ncbi:hypothetical protein BBK82_19600 [Lentzea guizhouensis]|uniref:Uncharacterized protein n=1 Tax=Lentzea guizhouensis TaxID=1586287 RepID=A0A1B2HJP2_9PSEU|nr:hypothetical protein [Lentzea guizhouensis]ANZ37934.1 hypothetical protein BBK82_19600 [Lentzea guizhouensis]